MNKSKIQGALIATAVAALFATSPALAQEEGAEKEDVKCEGANACKGTGACGGAGHACGGQNACKGQGWTKEKTKEDCEKKGGKVGAES